MKILHTSDWHLGRTFHQETLDTEQKDVLDQIYQIAKEQAVDVIVIAGDIYDRAVPPTQAMRILQQSLIHLTSIAQVIMSSGNHDSATRLGFGAPLMETSLALKTNTKDMFEPILISKVDQARASQTNSTDKPCQKGGQQVAFYALPYLLPDVLRYELAAPDDQPLERSHQAIWEAVTDRIRADLAKRKQQDPTLRSVIIGHAFVVGGSPSDSERDITVGGIDSVTASCFAGFDYVALGHLHGPQEIAASGNTTITYSGSPLRYSFSEANHQKSVTIVEINSDQPATYQRVPLTQPRGMKVLMGTLEEILSPENIEKYSTYWIRALVTDPSWPENLHTRIRVEFPYAVLIEHLPPQKDKQIGLGSTQVTELQPTDILKLFLADVANSQPDSETIQIFDSAYQTALGEDLS